MSGEHGNTIYPAAGHTAFVSSSMNLQKDGGINFQLHHEILCNIPATQPVCFTPTLKKTGIRGKVPKQSLDGY